MLMFAGSEEYYETFLSFPVEKRREALGMVAKWTADHSAAGRLLESNALQRASTATTVRVENGRAMVTDGPFIDAKERIGGYAIIEVPGLDEAIAMAKSWPAGGTVEIRPLLNLQDL